VSSASVPPRLHFIANSPVTGLAVAERRIEHPSATLICVHGALDRGGSFARLVRRLDDFDIVTYDRRGYQGSRSLAPVDLEHHVSDLLALIEREAKRQPVLLFGHSFGGVVTLVAAQREPALVRLVVNYESPMPWVRRRQSLRPPMTNDADAEAEQFFRRVVSDKGWDRLSPTQQESRRLDGPALLSDLAAIHVGDAPFDVATLHVPFTYVYGDGRLAEYYRALAADLVTINPEITTIEINDANHAAHLRNPDQLATIIEERWSAECASA
jgi:pimeloyl-ACP methyl ester carboxylesterase